MNDAAPVDIDIIIIIIVIVDDGVVVTPRSMLRSSLVRATES